MVSFVIKASWGAGTSGMASGIELVSGEVIGRSMDGWTVTFLTVGSLGVTRMWLVVSWVAGIGTFFAPGTRA